MISVVIPTLDSEHVLVPTLAALVQGAAAGIVRDVVLVDGGSNDETAGVADAAGCVFLRGPADLGARLRQGAALARSQWLLFLGPDGLLEEGWPRDVRTFLDQVERTGAAERRAGTFRLALDGFGMQPRLKEAAAVARHALTGRPRPEQGLLISRRLYDAVGGHGPGPNAPRQLLARLGRGRLVLLRSRIILPGE